MLPLPSSGQCHYTVAFSPCGRWLAAGGSDHAVDVWDLHAPQEPARRLQDLNGPIVRVQFATDGRLVAISTGWLGWFEAGTLTFLWNRVMGGARRAAVVPDGTAVIVLDNGLHRRAANAADEHSDWLRQEPSISYAVDLATCNGRVVTVAGRVTEPDGDLEIRNAGTGLLMDTVRVSGRPHRVACSADGTLAAVLANGHLSIWNLTARRSVVRRIAATHGGWLSVAFDPHGRRVVTGGIDSTVAVWDAASDGPPLTTFQWGVGPVYAVAFDRDGLRATAAGHSGAIVWDVDE
jgi:WD40 repeat protein